MEIDNGWVLSIAKVNNGYILSYDEEDREGILRVNTSLIEDKETDEDELEAMKELLHFVKEHFAVYYSKHNKRNLVIKIEGGEDD